MSAVVQDQFFKWMARKRCMVCFTFGVELAHFRGLVSAKTGKQLPRKIAQNSWVVIPLCTKHHRTSRDSIHHLGEEKFFEQHFGWSRNEVALIWARCLVDFLEGEDP